ncbi:hypothetical protein B0I35DRAFT_473047 [Stachybotrys elegans]|uniref:SH3 domain-containing protein n=1 Tax=Stachybotrys elegans TaxID=80388 RepID=A0A8K0WW55_9HYPO|nr:hypothetical protein B0I35DRAFT_473047 [Stachybotrys elegans]
MDEAIVLVVAPFRDIVEKGNAASENAGENEQMLKAAQSLVREGQRALKKIEPLTKKHFGEYRSNFIQALKENDDITKYRTELNDLLWEFDDYVESDTFELEKFTELQGLSRKAAPQIVDILTRMKLEAPREIKTASPPSPHLGPRSKSPGAIRAALPLRPPPNVPLPPIPAVPSAVTAPSPPIARSSAGSVSSSQGDRRLSTHSKPDISSKKAPSQPLSREHSIHAPRSEFTEPPPRHPERPMPPPLPNGIPWEPNAASRGDATWIKEGLPLDRRPMVAIPDFPSNLLIPEGLNLPKSPQPRARSGSGTSDGGHDLYRSSSPSSTLYNIFPGPSSVRARPGTSSAQATPAIPEDNVADTVPRSPPHEFHSPYFPSSQLRHLSGAFSVDSDCNSSTGHSQSTSSSAGMGYQSLTTISSKASTQAARHQADLELASTSPSKNIDHGLIPVVSDEAISPPESSRPTPRNCTIKGDSSYHLAKGFCAGALEVARGGIGVRKVKQSGSTVVARCISCLYELDFAQIEKDVNRQDEATHEKSGIEFRLRFLQKSHIAAKRNDDIPYACVFCIHAGRTIDESDATLFFTVQQLFEHLARHPRPLPDVPGVTVIDTYDVPSYLRNDFDVHFMNPPAKHAARDKSIENSHKPVGIARAPVRRIYGQRFLPDRTAALELAMGSRVTGLTWPEKYNGEWCLGWHDGKYASVPTECLRLDKPPAHDIRTGGTSSIRAKAKWRFKPEEEDQGDWLKFSKGETISNINWAYIDHWCWSGVNAKGKWGIFPQAFIDTNTIEELGATVTDRAISLHNEKAKSTGVFSRLGLRRNTSNNRPPSVAGSSSSHETTAAGLGNALGSPRIGRTQDLMFPGID